MQKTLFNLKKQKTNSIWWYYIILCSSQITTLFQEAGLAKIQSLLILRNQIGNDRIQFWSDGRPMVQTFFYDYIERPNIILVLFI